ncbi:MAG: M28 family peptidase, partial [Planctomycetota bacterium]
LGLLGARAFLQEHPWSRDVGLVLNFEARGSHGPSLMFETSNGNASLIREFAKVVPYPAASSLSQTIYDRMENATDLTLFKAAGVPGLNFAFIQGIAHYHTALDVPERLSLRSLQHHGSYALSLTRHFGNLDLQQTSEGDAVYFNPLRFVLVHYPASWALPLAVLGLLLVVGVVIRGMKQRRLTRMGMFQGFLALLSALIAAPLCVYLLWQFIAAVGDRPWYPNLLDYNNQLLAVSMVMAAAAVTTLIFQRFLKKISLADLHTGALLGWLPLSLYTSLQLSGASYLTTWSTLSGTVALLALPAPGKPFTTRRYLWFSFFSLPVLMLLVPVISQMPVALGADLSFVMAPLVVLTLSLWIPLLGPLVGVFRGWLPAWLGASSAVLILVVATSGDYDAEHPHPNSIFYSLQADSDEAVWGTLDTQPDFWVETFLQQQRRLAPAGRFFPLYRQRNIWQGQAPLVDLPPPEVQVLRDESNDGERQLVLQVRSPRKAPQLFLHIFSERPVRSLAIHGKQVPLQHNIHGDSLIYFGVPHRGLELVFNLDPAAALRLEIQDGSYQLPPVRPSGFRERPADTMPGRPDRTLVGKSFTF